MAKYFGNFKLKLKLPAQKKRKKIYGVEFKINLDLRKPYILELNFTDGGKFYQVFPNNYTIFVNSVFKKLDEAKKFLIKEYL